MILERISFLTPQTVFLTAFNKRVDELEARVKTVELENKILQEKVSKTESKTEHVKEQVGGIEKKIDAGMQKAKREVKEEMSAEMQKREKLFWKL